MGKRMIISSSHEAKEVQEVAFGVGANFQRYRNAWPKMQAAELRRREMRQEIARMISEENGA